MRFIALLMSPPGSSAPHQMTGSLSSPGTKVAAIAVCPALSEFAGLLLLLSFTQAPFIFVFLQVFGLSSYRNAAITSVVEDGTLFALLYSPFFFRTVTTIP